MGSYPSKNVSKCHWEMAEKRALIIYKYRIQNYNPDEHGTPTEYMNKINAEYEFVCIPHENTTNNIKNTNTHI